MPRSRRATSRREFLGHATRAAAGLALAQALPAPRASARSQRPNIVLLFSDDQRFDTIAALGNTEIHTPNLDRLVARGTCFTQAAIMGGLHGAICVPSRAMLHTGRHLFHLGGTGDVIPPEFTSLPEALRAAGYRTYATGKWHSDKAAFNRYYDAGGPIFFGGMNDHFNATVYDYDATGDYPKGAARTTGGTHDAEVYASAAINFLAQKNAKPFFLYVPFTMPHDPRTAPKEYHQRYDPAKLALPPSFMPEHPFDNGELANRDEQLAAWPRTPDVIRQHTADYYASITYLDAQVGRILDALEAQGQAENTLVVFAGDNGLAVGRHGLMGKQSLYDHSIRVPLILAGPGIPRGERRDTLCYVHDLFPTLCEAASAEIPATVESRSLLPAIADPATRIYESTFHAYRGVQRAVRDGKHKLIRYTVGGNTRVQLFDLAADPWELDDLSAREPGRVQALTAQLDAWRERVELR
jgi:arylsulfatase A-like enzyme